jgi:hypothetical protein
VVCSARSVAAATTRGTPCPIDVSVEERATPERLVFVLTNKSGKTITYARAFLPYYRRVLIVTAASAATQEPLRSVFPLESAQPGNLSLTPGASAVAEIDLTSWFPDLVRTLTTKDVVVLWRYTVRVSRSESCFAYGGITLSHK